MYENLKKKFGQNFLIDKNILLKITKLVDLSNLDILEIGPGSGKLTDYIILKKPQKLTLIEIDKELAEDLLIKYSKFNYIKVVNANILEIDLKETYQLVISNLPYNISSQIIVKLALLNKSFKVFSENFLLISVKILSPFSIFKFSLFGSLTE